MSRRVVYISAEVLLALLSMDGTKTYRIDGMPKDARIVGVSDQVRFLQNEIAVKIESPEFDDWFEGVAIPELKLTVTVVDG